MGRKKRPRRSSTTRSSRKRSSDPPVPPADKWRSVGSSEHVVIQSTAEMFGTTVPGQYCNTDRVCHRFEHRLFSESARLFIWNCFECDIRIAFHCNKFKTLEEADPFHHLSVGFSQGLNVDTVLAKIVEATQAFFDGKTADGTAEATRDPNKVYAFMDQFIYEKLRREEPDLPLLELIDKAERAGRILEEQDDIVGRQGWPDKMIRWRFKVT